MTYKHLAAVAMVFGLTTAPALAVPFCNDSQTGMSFEFGMRFGEPKSEADQNQDDLRTLRRRGVNATRVERWNGCLRAFVTQPGGGERMEFYDPNTYRQVY